jgi:hypothetical protein
MTSGSQSAQDSPKNDAHDRARVESLDRTSFEELWKAVFDTYYDAFFNEVVADRVINRWQIVDDTSKILIAVTASGSAISGWALWNQPGYRLVWTGLATLSAVIGIVHTSLAVAHRVRDWVEIKRSFASLRIELETLMYRMKFDFKAGNREFKREFIKQRRQYLKAVQRLRNDILLRKGLEVTAQRDLDKRLAQDQQTKGDHHGN